MENYYVVDLKNYDNTIKKDDNDNLIIIENDIYDILEMNKYIIFNNKIQHWNNFSYNNIKNNKFNFYFNFINSYKYLEDLETCFKNISNLIHQVNIDFARSNIYFNNIPINNLSHFYNYLDYKNYSLIKNNKCINLIYKLSTQSVVGEIFELIQNKISQYELFLGSGNTTNKSLYINFNFYENHFTFNVKKNFRVFTINDNSDDEDISKCDILFTGNIDYQLENIDKNFILKISFS